MKVILTKKAEYDLCTEKLTEIPSAIFEQLVGEQNDTPYEYDTIDEVVVFDNKADYLLKRSEFDIDTEKPVYMSSKGQIFRFINKKNTSGDGTTDTQEDNTAES